MIHRVGDQRLHGLVAVETRAHVDFAVRQAEVRQPAGAGFLLLEFLRMHQEHEARARRHRPQGRTPAELFGPKTFVTHYSHGLGPTKRGSAEMVTPQAWPGCCESGRRVTAPGARWAGAVTKQR